MRVRDSEGATAGRHRDENGRSNCVIGRRRALIGGVVATLPLVAGCSGSEPQLVEVAPNALAFRPGTESPLTVTAGTTVRFVWASGGHNLHVERQPEGASWSGHEPIEAEGFEHEHTFDTPGEYHFWCTPHRSAGMVGDIVVEPGGGYL